LNEEKALGTRLPRIVFQPGIQIAVDILPRKPVQTDSPRDPVEDHIDSIIVDSLPLAITLQELLITSESDPTLKIINNCLNPGNWDTSPEPFKALKDELCQKRGLGLSNNCIVVPEAMRPCILQLAHEGHRGHQGITKLKQHLRQRAWWPGMAMQVERHVRECLGCGIVRPKLVTAFSFILLI